MRVQTFLNSLRQQPQKLVLTVPVLTLFTLLLFSLSLFVWIPYVGFSFDNNGIIQTVYTPEGESLLLSGDRLTSVGAIPWEAFREERGRYIFQGLTAGQTVTIERERNGVTSRIEWMLHGVTGAELWSRLNSTWWIGYTFWLAGTFTVFFVRPKNRLWTLLVAAYYLTALWLAVGTVSNTGILHSRVWLGALLVICLPFYWHLHWEMPTPLGRLPRAVVPVLYAGSLLVAVLYGFSLLPATVPIALFTLATAGSFVLLIAHAIFQPRVRTNLRLLFSCYAIVFTAGMVLGFGSVIGSLTPPLMIVFLAFPLLPAAYLYTIYKKQLVTYSIRVNRAIIAYIYVMLLAVCFGLLFSLPGPAAVISLSPFLAGFLIALGTTAVTLAGYERIHAWLEHYVLGFPPTPTSLLESYAAHITISNTHADLVAMLTKQVLPALLVRQSALLRLDGQDPVLIYRDGITAEQVPSATALARLIAAGKHHIAGQGGEAERAADWAHVCIPLVVNHRTIGVWLLGNRDPDDLYTEDEIDILRAIANQTAIAVINIEQSTRLQRLYQIGIEVDEAERKRLARELHDEILNELAAIMMFVDDMSPQFQRSYEQLSYRLRRTIHNLRPVMLNYGLWRAISQLVDDLKIRYPDINLRFTVVDNHCRHSDHIEPHAYRIIQQLLENALRHAAATSISIDGLIEADRIDLTVNDNGRGFAWEGNLSLEKLLDRRHYGLVNIYERCELIGAQLHLTSRLSKGTAARFHWSG